MKVDELRIMGDERGKLISLESCLEVPFQIKRVFYIYGTKPNIPRGQHSHYKTKQYLIAVSGSCCVTLDDGTKAKTFLLDKPSTGLFQDAMIWGAMHDFTPDCVLLVLANDYYDEADYIRSYDEFRKIVAS